MQRLVSVLSLVSRNETIAMHPLNLIIGPYLHLMAAGAQRKFLFPLPWWEIVSNLQQLLAERMTNMELHWCDAACLLV